MPAHNSRDLWSLKCRTLIEVEMYLLLHFLGPQNFPQTGVMHPSVLHCTAVKPGICQIVRYKLLHFYRTQTLHGNWKALLRNLAFKRAFSRYGRKMALASASSYTQFSAVCTSGNGKKGTNLVFQGPKLFRNFRLPVSTWKNMSKCSYRSKM